jgi:phage major head subunit gpT-like protein
VLDSLTEDGEFKNKALSDAEKATITVATKGNIINISRQMIVNDDMGAFTRLPMMMGRAAALSVEVDVYAHARAEQR